MEHIVQAIFALKEILGVAIDPASGLPIRLAAAIEGLNIAAGTEGPIASASKVNHGHGRIVAPLDQGRSEGIDHGQIEGI